MREALAQALSDLFGEQVEIESARLVGGGASKEAWAVDAGGRRLLVRRAGGGVIHRFTLPLADELRVLEVAWEAGVKVPRPYGYVPDLAGREAFVMERVEGETIGRRIVKDPPAALPLQMAEELAKIHALPPLDFLPRADRIATLTAELDSVDEPHPAIELGLHWLREHLPGGDEVVLCHGDFRLGNLVVRPDEGLVAVLDWEFAHLGSPLADLAWPLVRSWRFGVDGKRLAGIADPEPYLERYEELTGRTVSRAELDAHEIAGNVAWAIGCLTQARRHLRGEERSVELAVLGRLAAGVEWELLHLLERAA